MSGDAIEDVAVRVGGMEFRGWQEVNVSRSREQAAISFGLKATNPIFSAEAKALRKGPEVEILASGSLLVRGYVDEYDSEHGEQEHREVRVAGRSKAQDAIDCQPAKHKTGRIEKKTLLEVAKEFDEFGTNWTTDTKLEKLEKIQRRPDETTFQTIERSARRQGLMLEGKPDGSINITKGGSKRHAGSLSDGGAPVEKFTVSFKPKDRRSPVIAKGQRVKGEGDKEIRQEVQSFDGQVGRYRPLVLFVEGDATEKELKKRAENEKLRRAGAGTSIRFTVSRWRDEGGQLWEPGRLMALKLPSEDVDGDFLLSSVVFRQDHKGTRAELTFVDPRSQGGKKPGGKTDPGYGVDKDEDD